jgi:hypothetical protein
MNGPLLQDLIRRGLGRAAIAVGEWCDAYRPAGTADPLADENRFMRMPVSFTSHHGANEATGYGQPTWLGVFDAAYTRPGDYLVRRDDAGHAPAGGAGSGGAGSGGVGSGGVWFIASQQPLLPVLCVRATRIVCFTRPASPGSAGMNGYGGTALSTATPLASGWPASVLTGRGAGMDKTPLPSDPTPGTWSVLLPGIAGVVLRPGDLMTDDIGRTGVVSAAELSDLGWRLLVRQATT